jgi:hypothetical protein
MAGRELDLSRRCLGVVISVKGEVDLCSVVPVLFRNSIGIGGVCDFVNEFKFYSEYCCMDDLFDDWIAVRWCFDETSWIHILWMSVVTILPLVGVPRSNFC